MTNPGKRAPVILEMVTYAVAGLLLGAIFFRQIVFSHFDLLCGDTIDSRFNGVILEHWWQVLRGTARWLSPQFFYPAQGVLGYGDAEFLYALPYVALRFFGIEPFTSYQLVLFALVAAGWAGMLLFLRRCLKLSIFPAILGAALFIFPNSMAVSIVHTQLLTICFIPYLAMAVYVILQASWKVRPIGTLAGISVALLVPAIFYTSYYVGWFVTFYCLLLSCVCCVWAVVHSGRQAAWRSAIWRRIKWHRFLPFCALTAICFIPFLLTYIPALRQCGARPYYEIATMEPSFVDYVNVGPNNWLWGKVFHSTMVRLASRPMVQELTKGVPCFLLLACLAFLVYYVRKIRHYQLEVAEHGGCKILVDGNEANDDERLGLIGAGLGTTVLLAWVLMLKIGDHSLWWFVAKGVPGAGAVRAVYRFQHVLSFPLAIVVAIGVHQCINHAAHHVHSWGKRSAYCAALGVFCLLLLVEQFNSGSLARCNKTQQLNMLAGISEPPQQAKVFALLRPVGPKMKKIPAEAQVDAMIIAQKYGLSTINGYSGQIPNGWNGISHYDKPQYMWALDRWIRHYNLESEHLAFLDAQTGSWVRAAECRLTLPTATDADLAALRVGEVVRVLNLSSSHVTSDGLAYLKGMTRLQELYLGGTWVTDSGLSHLEGLQNVETLRLGKTKVTDAGLVHLEEMKGLIVLDLSYTQVTDAGLVHLKGMQDLMMLVLNNTKVADDGMVYLKEMKGLEILALSNTQVTDAGLAHLRQIANLHDLLLNGTRVTDAGLLQLKEIRSLVHVNLSNTHVTDAGVADLKATLPKIEISR